MTTDPSETFSLLHGVHRGDDTALSRLLERDLPFIAKVVRKRLGPELRSREETDDLVQEAAIAVLREGPQFLVSDREQFRKLLCRLVENVIRDRARWHKRKRRDAGRDRPLGTAFDLGDSARATPSRILDSSEESELLRLALELLDPDDREILLLHEYDGLGFPAIGERLGLTPNAARMRFQRALPRLAKVSASLRAGQLQSLLEEGSTGHE